TALAQQTTALRSDVDGNTAGITSVQQTVSDTESALSSRIDGISARAGNNETAINSEQTARADADSALGSRIDSVTATAGDNSAAITEEVRVRADETSANAARISGLTLNSSQQKAAIQALERLRQEGTEIEAIQFESINVESASRSASVRTEEQARIEDGVAFASRMSSIETSVDDVDARVTSEASARSDADTALGTRIDTVTAEADDNAAALQSESTARADADTALGTRIDTVQAEAGDNSAAIQTETTARTDADTALGSRIDTVVATVGDNSAAIQSEQQARVTADDALATDISTVQSSLGDEIASVEQQTQASIDEQTGRINAMWTLRTDVNGLVGGIGLANDGQQVDFSVRADRFSIAPPGLPNDAVIPFIVKGSTTYLEEALIESLTFTKLQDGDGEFLVENGKLQAKYIHADDLVIKRGRSDNFVSGQSGWALNPTGGQINFPISFSNVQGGPPANADRTSSNTSADTAKVAGTDAATVRDVAEDSVLDPGFTRTVNGHEYWSRPSSSVSFADRGDFGPCATFKAEDEAPIIVNTNRGGSGQHRISVKGGQSVSVSFTGYYGPRLSGSANAFFRAGAQFFDSGMNSLGYHWVTFWPETDSFVHSGSNPDGPVKIGQLSDYSGVVTAPDTAAYGIVRFQVRNCRFFLTHLDVDLKSAARTWIRPNSTMIDGNKIFTGDAYVDTLQIKGRAVTIATASRGAGEVPVGSKWKNVLTLNFNAEGGRSTVIASAGYDFSGTDYAGSGGTARASVSGYARLLINGVPVYTGLVGSDTDWEESSSGSGGAGGGVSATARISGVFSFTHLINAGHNQSAQIQFRCSGGGGDSHHRTLTALATKR
ncbi:MAG: DUF1983 domain-containing protein, partial [Yaniella sp.]|nr:DUF1983 domain-containing protein [Yaniella sp.]